MDAFLHTFFDWDEMMKVFPTLLTEGIKNTLFIAVLAILFSLVLGMILAMMLLSNTRWLKLPARIYIDIFRGLPADFWPSGYAGLGIDVSCDVNAREVAIQRDPVMGREQMFRSPWDILLAGGFGGVAEL